MVHKFALPPSDLRDPSHSSHRRWGSPHRRDSGPGGERREGGREERQKKKQRGREEVKTLVHSDILVIFQAFSTWYIGQMGRTKPSSEDNKICFIG